MHIRSKITIEISDDDLLEKTDLSDTVEIRYQGVYLDVSQTKHGIMQMKTPDYMPKVNTKLAYCNLKFVTGPFSHWKNA